MMAAEFYSLLYQEAMEAGYRGDFPVTCWAMRRWPRPAPGYAQDHHPVAAPARCSEEHRRPNRVLG